MSITPHFTIRPRYNAKIALVKLVILMSAVFGLAGCTDTSSEFASRICPILAKVAKEAPGQGSEFV